MANGIIAHQTDAAALKVASSTSAVPVYLGQAPIWQVDRPDWADLAGATIVAKSIDDIRAKIGYMVSKNKVWSKENSLSMVAFYHVNVEKILPVIMIVNKAAIEVSSSKTTEEVTFVKGVAKIDNPNIVVSSFEITGKVKGTDYSVAYDDNGQELVITDITGLSTESASYNVVELTELSFSADTYEEVDFIPQNTGMIPATIAAPLWETEEDTDGRKVNASLIKIAEGVIDKHYFLQAFGQLSSSTRSLAITEKEAYDSAKIKICWPYAQVGDYVYPLSLVYSAKRHSVDSSNDGIPFESASNEEVPIKNLCDASGALVKQLEKEADELNAVGIATMAFVTSMRWVTWGICMANYSEIGKEGIPANKLNDVAVQMMDFICNDFEQRFGEMVHKPMSIRAVNDIVNSYNNVLRTYISKEILIEGVISFEPSENNTASLADGQFVYNIAETNTPPAKAIIAKVTFDTNAYESYFADAKTE